MMFLTINALPEAKELHALFMGAREGSYGFEITGHGPLLVPETHVDRGECGAFKKGEDLHVTRDHDVLVVRRSNS